MSKDSENNYGIRDASPVDVSDENECFGGWHKCGFHLYLNTQTGEYFCNECAHKQTRTEWPVTESGMPAPHSPFYTREKIVIDESTVISAKTTISNVSENQPLLHKIYMSL